jgi:hypothetical protein
MFGAVRSGDLGGQLMSPKLEITRPGNRSHSNAFDARAMSDDPHEH